MTATSAEPVAAETLRGVLKSQYHAALAMLESVVERFPEERWTQSDAVNAPWQVAYHVLFFTHLYLQPEEATFRRWLGHRPAQHEDGIAGPADSESELPLVPDAYGKEEVLDYLRFCDALVDPAMDSLDLHRPDSGFYWYDVSKLEHQLINIRHVQHHAAQLADRLRSEAGLGTRWVAARRPGESG